MRTDSTHPLTHPPTQPPTANEESSERAARQLRSPESVLHTGVFELASAIPPQGAESCPVSRARAAPKPTHMNPRPRTAPRHSAPQRREEPEVLQTGAPRDPRRNDEGDSRGGPPDRVMMNPRQANQAVPHPRREPPRSSCWCCRDVHLPPPPPRSHHHRSRLWIPRPTDLVCGSPTSAGWSRSPVLLRGSLGRLVRGLWRRAGRLGGTSRRRARGQRGCGRGSGWRKARVSAAPAGGSWGLSVGSSRPGTVRLGLLA